jgi:hypothetical protein
MNKYILYITTLVRHLIKYERKSHWSDYELINAEVIESSEPDMIGFSLKNMDIHCAGKLLEFKDETSARLAFEVCE